MKIKALIAFVMFTGVLFGQTTTYTGTVKDLSGALVTSGNVTFTLTPSVDTTISGTSRFSPLTVNCTINGSGALVANDGVSACVVTQNTALTPTGTSYTICIQPQFTSPGSCFVDYAVTSSKDISTVAPTPQLSPTYPVYGTFFGTANTWTAEQKGKDFLISGPGVCDGTTDDTTAIQAALTAANGTGGRVIIPPNKTCKVSTTLTLGQGAHLVSQDRSGGGANPLSVTLFGPTIKWAGANSAVPVIKLMDASFSSVEGVNVDCGASATSVIGIQYTSDNNPPSSHANIRNLAVNNCHQGIVAGDFSNVAVTNCNATPNQVGCYEADFAEIANIQCYGSGTDLTAECIHINSANALQASQVKRISGQLINKLIRVVNTNGELRIEDSNAGSPVGTSPTMIQVDTTATSPILINNECEGAGWTYAVHDSGTSNGGTTPPANWIGNGFFCPVLVDGTTNYSMQANSGNTAAWVAAGSTWVDSYSDARLWAAPQGNAVIDYSYLGRHIMRGPFCVGCKVTGSGVNSDTSSNVAVEARSSVLTTTGQRSVVASSTYSGTGTNVDFAATPSIAASTAAADHYSHWAFPPTMNSGATLTNWRGFVVSGTCTAGISNCYGFHNLANFPNNLGTGVTTVGTVNFGASNGLSSGGSGIVNVGNGTAGDASGTINYSAVKLNGVTLASATAPTITSGFGTSPSLTANGTAAVMLNVGTGGTASSGTITMPFTAAHGWSCSVNNINASVGNRADNTVQISYTTTNVTVQNQTKSTGVGVAWTASDVVLLNCGAF